MAEIVSKEALEKCGIFELRDIMREMGGTPGVKPKAILIDEILDIQNGVIKPMRSPRGRKPAASHQALDAAVAASDQTIRLEEEEKVQEKLIAASPSYMANVASASPVTPLPPIGAQPTKEELPEGTVSGVLEILMDGYGFLRASNYETTPGDVYVSPQMLRFSKLRRGDFVVGKAERTRETGAENLTEIISVNGQSPRADRRNFDDLIPCYPNKRLTLETESIREAYTLRIMDILCPLGKGQRGLIVAPPKTGKTTLLKKTAQSLERNYPNIHLIVLLIDERPEEVTDLRRSINGEVVYSTFDEPPEHHVRAAELVMWRAKRLAELGRDVVILLDSITRLTRAYNQVVQSNGKILSGGIDSAALQAPKKFFGSARNLEEGGSITILATALIDTGSKMDDVIYEAFKGTGNMEIHLTRELSERRIFPAIDLLRSGTRKDELLLTDEEMNCANAVRKFLSREDGVETLIDMIKKTSDNVEFVSKFASWVKLMDDGKRTKK